MARSGKTKKPTNTKVSGATCKYAENLVSSRIEPGNPRFTPDDQAATNSFHFWIM